MKIDISPSEVVALKDVLFRYRDDLVANEVVIHGFSEIEKDERYRLVESILDRIANAEIKDGRARAYRPPSPRSS